MESLEPEQAHGRAYRWLFTVLIWIMFWCLAAPYIVFSSVFIENGLGRIGFYIIGFFAIALPAFAAPSQRIVIACAAFSPIAMIFLSLSYISIKLSSSLLIPAMCAIITIEYYDKKLEKNIKSFAWSQMIIITLIFWIIIVPLLLSQTGTSHKSQFIASSIMGALAVIIPAFSAPATHRSAVSYRACIPVAAISCGLLLGYKDDFWFFAEIHSWKDMLIYTTPFVSALFATMFVLLFQNHKNIR